MDNRKTSRLLLNKLPNPFIITLMATLFMFLTIFLPYGTANKKQEATLKQYPDQVLYEELDITAKDMIHISMVEYTKIYSHLSEQFWGDTSYGVFYIVLVAFIGIFSLLSTLFTILKKPIAITIFSLLSFGVFCIHNSDYRQRGVIPSSSYDWGVGYYVFYIAFAIALVGAVWMLISQINQKKH